MRLGTSTGTTGQPTITVWTRRDLWIEYESGARNWWRMGYRPGTIVTHAHPAYLYGGGVMLQGTYEYLGLLSLWVPRPTPTSSPNRRCASGPGSPRTFPSWASPPVGSSRWRPNSGIPLEDAGLTGLKAPPGFGLGRGGMPLMTAGAECYAYVGGPCGQSPGAHIHEDWAVVQAVDPATGREVPDGEWGNLTVTTLDRDNGLLRYDLEEACAILRGPCPCGETSIRGLWGGRFADLLSCQGTRFQLSEVEAALRTEKLVAQPSLEYQIIRPDDGPAPLEVRVEVATEDPDARSLVADRVAMAIEEAVGVHAVVELLVARHPPPGRLQGQAGHRPGVTGTGRSGPERPRSAPTRPGKLRRGDGAAVGGARFTPRWR